MTTYNGSLIMYTYIIIIIFMQFTLMMLGLNEANAKYSCAWCKVSSDER